MADKTILDVSRWQGCIDWDAVKRSGKIDGVMLKAVSTNRKLSKRKDGLYIDPTFERNYAECKRVGLPVGVYYYTYATDKEMADAELALLKTALTGKTFELPISVDVEDNKIKKLSTQALTYLAAYALATVERWGFYALLYVGLNFAQTELYMGGAALQVRCMAGKISQRQEQDQTGGQAQNRLFLWDVAIHQHRQRAGRERQR